MKDIKNKHFQLLDIFNDIPADEIKEEFRIRKISLREMLDNNEHELVIRFPELNKYLPFDTSDYLKVLWNIEGIAYKMARSVINRKVNRFMCKQKNKNDKTLLLKKAISELKQVKDAINGFDRSVADFKYSSSSTQNKTNIILEKLHNIEARISKLEQEINDNTDTSCKD